MESYYETDYGRLYNGHVLETLKSLPSDTVSCCITSPPYWALRDYGTDGVVWDGDADCEHEWGNSIKQDKNWRGGTTNPDVSPKMAIKGKTNFAEVPISYSNFCNKCGAWKGQLGLEPDFNLYIKHLCDIFDEVKRVLRKDGTCWVNLGDTYNGSGGAGGDYNKGGLKEGQPTYKQTINKSMPPKTLCNIPSRFSIEMQNRGWILRNKIIWHKPNCMPSSVTDRFTVDFEEIFFFVKSKKYWFEQQTEELANPTRTNFQSGHRTHGINKDRNDNDLGERSKDFKFQNRNKRTVWKIPTQPFPDAHFAVFPEKLVETPIKAGCPKEICTKCGKPREKVKVPIGEFEFDEIEYYNNTDKSKPYSVVPREGYVPVRQLPNMDKLKIYLQDARKKVGYTIDEVEDIMDSQAPHHWFNGEAYPTVEDWGRIKELLQFDSTYDKAMTEIKYKPAEKCQTKYKDILTKCDCNAPFVAGIVLDPFMGSGTTAVYCEKNHYRWIGCEVSDKYCEMIKGRLEPYKKQTRLI